MAKAVPKPVVVKQTLQEYQGGQSGGRSEAGTCRCSLHQARHEPAKITRETTGMYAHVQL
jgi:hypothetical protein